MILRPIPVSGPPSRTGLAAHLRSQAHPLIVKHAMDDWPAMRRWTFQHFAERYSYFPIEAFAPQFDELARWGVRTTLSAYVTYLEAPHTGEIEGQWLKGDPQSLRESGQTLYAGNFNPAHPRYGRPDLLFEDVPRTPSFIECWLPLLHPVFVERCQRIQPHYFVYLSAPGAYTPLHMDFWDTHAFLAQIRGKKRAVLFAPEHEALLLADETRDARRMKDDPRYASVVGWEGFLDPGDLLVLPSRWLHFVETLEPSITYSADWVDGVNWRQYVRYGKAMLRQHGRWP